jgi:hypothetical protein
MRFLIDGVEVEAAVELDDTIDEIKTKLGVGPVYLYAQKKVVTSLFRDTMSKEVVAALLANSGVVAELKPHDDEVFLELDGEQIAWISLGQAGLPGETGGTPKNLPLLHYLPLVNDAVYGSTETPPAYNRRFKFTPRETVLRDVNVVSGSEIVWVRAKTAWVKSPAPLAELFRTLHADADTPVLRFQGMRRCVPGAVLPPPAENALVVAFNGGWAAFSEGSCEVECGVPQRDAVECEEALAEWVNPFLEKMGSPPFRLESVDMTLAVRFPFQLVRGAIPAALEAIFAEPLAFRRTGFAVEVRAAEFLVTGIDHVGHLPFVEGYLRMLAVSWRGAPIELESDDEIEVPKEKPVVAVKPPMDAEYSYFAATSALLRESLQPADRAEIHRILAGHRKVGRVLEVVERVLGPKLEVVEMPVSFGYKCGKRPRMLVPKTNLTTGRPNYYIERLAEELVNDAKVRAFLLAERVRVGGVEYEVTPPEVLVQEFRVSRVI